MQFLQPPVTSTFHGPNILLSALFRNTLSLCSAFNVRDRVSHPYRTTGNITVLYILVKVELHRLILSQMLQEQL
jgi:hypothetical protein